VKKYRWLIILFPFFLGVILALFIFLYYDRDQAHIVYLRADLGTLSLVAGILLTILTSFVIWLLERVDSAYQKAAAQAAEEHRRFLRRLDHELKNPLTAIRAGLANLSESPAGSVSQGTLASLDTQTLRMSRLSSDLRKLAEIEVRQVERLPVDIPDLLNEAFHLAQENPAAMERTINMTLPHAPWPLPPIMGDADLLMLAVHNLLDNSIKFTRPGDTVELRAFEDGQNVVIEVADTGPGIPEEEQHHVWEELFRGESSRGIPGSGLGLALVRSIMDRHGGTVRLRSRLEKGTVVTLRLPAG
jgi:two-component system OmpR family sensor kinase